MPKYELTRTLHQDSTVPVQPQFDTLIGVCNPYSTSQSFDWHVYDSSGNELPGSPMQKTLDPGHSLAATLIKGNGFDNPPNNFSGYSTIEFTDKDLGPTGSVPGIGLPVVGCLGGGGPTPKNWNQFSPAVHMNDSAQVSSGPASRWVFPYFIHFADPTQHAGPQAYQTGISIRNRGTIPVSLVITITGGDGYANAGIPFVATIGPIAPQACYTKLLHEIFPQLLTLNERLDGSGNSFNPPEYEGCEGWMNIELQAGSTEQSDLTMWLCCANAAWDCFAFSQAPWIISQ